MKPVFKPKKELDKTQKDLIKNPPVYYDPADLGLGLIIKPNPKYLE
jgi:hypothetical protein